MADGPVRRRGGRPRAGPATRRPDDHGGRGSPARAGDAGARPRSSRSAAGRTDAATRPVTVRGEPSSRAGQPAARLTAPGRPHLGGRRTAARTVRPAAPPFRSGPPGRRAGRTAARSGGRTGSRCGGGAGSRCGGAWEQAGQGAAEPAGGTGAGVAAVRTVGACRAEAMQFAAQFADGLPVFEARCGRGRHAQPGGTVGVEEVLLREAHAVHAAPSRPPRLLD